jgi:predicted acylesterase/phospholipase RssA
MSPSDFSQPTRLCDLVMKGGVTSGVVYPPAVCELARQYSFKNIGGTSAGAIAAAAAAAAEYARRSGAPEGTGFAALAHLPMELAQEGRLLRLFSPHPSVRALFDVAVAALSARSTAGIIAAIAAQVLRSFFWQALIAALVAVVLAYWLLGTVTGPGPRVYVLITSIIIAVAGFALFVAIALYRQLTRALPDNFYGLASGFSDQQQGAPPAAPLTNWLTHYFNLVAGKPLQEGPLTFGDLYGAPLTPAETAAGLEKRPGSRAINLEMMSTALNHGRPYRLPFHDPDQIFFFSAREFSKLFPTSIVNFLIEHQRLDEDPAPQLESGERLYGFPKPENLPVVVATRMSLSFPLLLSAVPLYARDFTRRQPMVERCWFSDGGICSNLPLHFFDAPLPRWPTFGINLKPFHPDHKTEEEAVHLSKSANRARQPIWNRFEDEAGSSRVSAFLFAILETMQNWRDNAQASVPGHRDRLVHISQSPDEGGLNLKMMQHTIERLSDRGRRAGIALVERFGDAGAGPGPGWPEQRWVRFRTTMDRTIDWVRRLVSGYDGALPGDPSFEKLLIRPDEDLPDIYRVQAKDQPRAKEIMDQVRAATEGWEPGVGNLDEGPRPTPELRITPRT